MFKHNIIIVSSDGDTNSRKVFGYVDGYTMLNSWSLNQYFDMSYVFSPAFPTQYIDKLIVEDKDK